MPARTTLPPDAGVVGSAWTYVHVEREGRGEKRDAAQRGAGIGRRDGECDDDERHKDDDQCRCDAEGVVHRDRQARDERQ